MFWGSVAQDQCCILRQRTCLMTHALCAHSFCTGLQIRRMLQAGHLRFYHFLIAQGSSSFSDSDDSFYSIAVSQV